MIMRLVRIVFLGIFLISFLTGKSQIENDPYVKKVFSSEEIQSLDKLLSFVDKQVLLKTKKENIAEAYHALFDTLQIYMTNNEKDKVPMEENLRAEIFQILKEDNIFNEIFIEGIPIKAYLNDTVFENPEFLKYIEINPNGKYRKLLKLMSKVDPGFNYINESFNELGELSITLVAGMIMNSENYQFEIDRIRLFGAIVYLTREETMQTSYENYLKNKK